MIGEGDRQYILSLVRREGIDQVLLALADVVQMMPPDHLAGEAISAELKRERINYGTSKQDRKRLAADIEAALTESARHRKQAEMPTIVHAKAPARSKRKGPVTTIGGKP
jgi:hypothetical protein